jgi:hypothetical protein
MRSISVPIVTVFAGVRMEPCPFAPEPECLPVNGTQRSQSLGAEPEDHRSHCATAGFLQIQLQTCHENDLIFLSVFQD